MNGNIKELLKTVIDNTVECVNLPFIPVGEIQDILKELGVNVDNVEMNTNGWEIDFWNTYSFNNNEYQLSGSLYFGDIKFQILKDE